jgi:hypothetical protein
MATSAWLIGSRPHVPETEIRVVANSVTEFLTVPAGDYYLWDGTASQSLVDAVATAIATHSEITSCDGDLRQNRKAVFVANVAFEITSWGAGDNIVRNMLGFSSTTAAALATQEANNVSPYLWSPKKPESSDVYPGRTGRLMKDTAVGQAGTSVISATQNNTSFQNTFRWRNVLVERYQSSSEPAASEGGTYEAFWGAVLSRFYRFRLYRNVTDTTATTIVTPLSTVLPTESTLAYTMRPTQNITFPYRRTIQWVERYNNVDLRVLTRPDY